jgi:sugar lactone lactonase YvrE
MSIQSKDPKKPLFNIPRDLDIDNECNIYVVDSMNNKIQKFASDGKFLLSWGNAGSKEGEVKEPCGIGIDRKKSCLYLADTWNHRIQRFSLDGKYQTSWSCNFYGPRDIVIDNDGNLYVTDTGYCLIKKFNPDGKLLMQFGSKGSDDGQLQEPIGLGINLSGNVAVADTWNQRLQIFKPDGSFIRKFDVSGWYGNTLIEPYMVIDGKGNFWLTDSAQKKIFIYDIDGILQKVLSVKTADGTICSPIGIALYEKANKLIISSFEDNSVQIVQMK